MNNNKISKSLKEVLKKTYDTFPYTKEFISNNLMEICPKKKSQLVRYFLLVFGFIDDGCFHFPVIWHGDCLSIVSVKNTDHILRFGRHYYDKS